MLEQPLFATARKSQRSCIIERAGLIDWRGGQRQNKPGSVFGKSHWKQAPDYKSEPKE